MWSTSTLASAYKLYVLDNLYNDLNIAGGGFSGCLFLMKSKIIERYSK